MEGWAWSVGFRCGSPMVGEPDRKDHFMSTSTTAQPALNATVTRGTVTGMIGGAVMAMFAMRTAPADGTTDAVVGARSAMLSR